MSQWPTANQVQVCKHVQDVRRHDDPDLVVLATDECLFADEGFRSVRKLLLLTVTASVKHGLSKPNCLPTCMVTVFQM